MAYDIVTIGSATRDVFMRAKDLMVIKDARFKTGAAECMTLGSKVEISEIFYTIGGSAANTAMTFVRQGLKTACITKVGKDIRGDEITRVLLRARIDTRFIKKDSRHMSPYSVVLLTSTGERSILVYRGAGEYLQGKDIPQSAFQAKWLYITHLGGKSAEAFPWLIHKAKKHNVKIAINPGATQLRMPPNKLRPLLSLIDALILNREEASYLTKIPFQKPHLIFEKLNRWVGGLIVMTDGPNGLVVSNGKYRWHAGILHEQKRIDRTGAGDAFGSGFIAGLSQGKDIPHAIQLGSANATSVLEYMGAQPGILYKHDSIYKWGRLKIQKETIKNEK